MKSLLHEATTNRILQLIGKNCLTEKKGKNHVQHKLIKGRGIYFP